MGGKWTRCRNGVGSLGHNTVLQAVIELGAAVNGNGRSAGGVDEGNEFYSVSFIGFFHHGDSNKAGLRGRKGFDLKLGKSFLICGPKTLWNAEEGAFEHWPSDCLLRE
jgi:hypothetical protein